MAISTSDYNHSSRPWSVGIPSEGMFRVGSEPTTDVPSSPTVGQFYYDETLGRFRGYTAAEWAQFGGTAAASQDAAYNGGASMTVDAGPLTLNDTQTATGGGLLITKSGAITGATNASVFHINSTGAHDSSGTVKMLEISVGTETVSGAIYGVEIAMNANTDLGVLITQGAMTLTDGALTLTAGALTVSNGAITHTTGDVTIADGSIALTDADNASSLVIVNDSCTTADLIDVSSTGSTTGALVKLNANAATHDGEVLEIISAGDTTSTPVGISVTIASPTTGAARGIEVTMAAATTTAKGIAVTMDAITTGDMLYLDNGGASMTGDGKFINCNDDDASAFSVAANGLTTIAGSASGTDALVITAGDILLTSGLIDMTIGDLTLADGSVTITDADNANSLAVTNNTITTGDLVSVASTSISTGALVKLNANTAAHDGEVLEIISAGDTTSTPVGISVTIASPTTGAARGIEVTMVGATTTAKGIAVTCDAMTTGDMLYLDNGGNAFTEGSGFYINCNDDNASYFTVGKYGEVDIAGKAAATAALTIALGDLVITDTDTTTITSVNGIVNTVEIISGGAVGAGKGTLVIDQAGTLNATGSLLRLEADGITDTNSPVAMYIDCSGVDAGGLTIDTDVATLDGVIISGSGVVAAGKAMLAVTNDAAIADGAFYVDITSGANGAASTASYLLHVDASHTQIEAIHVDAGNVLFDENLTTTGTLTQTGIATFATGMTQTAVARTPTADGTGAAVIAAGTSMVNVNGGTNANCWLTLPTPVVGHVIWLLPEGTGYEIRSNQPATVAISGGTDTNGESPITAADTVRLVCTSATTWIGTIYDAASAESDVAGAAD